MSYRCYSEVIHTSPRESSIYSAILWTSVENGQRNGFCFRTLIKQRPKIVNCAKVHKSVHQKCINLATLILFTV